MTEPLQTQRKGPAPGFVLVFRREVRRIMRRPGLLFLVLVFPLLVFFCLAAIFRGGVPTDLPIVVIDHDRTTISRQIISQIDATAEVAVAYRVNDLASARALVVDGSAYGALLLPANLERDARAGRQPEIVIFYNNQFMTPGSIVARAMQTAASTVSSAIAVSARMAHGEPRHRAVEAANPIPLQQSPLFNPGLDYTHFLLAALLPAALQIFIAASTVYTVTLERQIAGGLGRIERLGGGIAPAMIGKLLPYTIAYTAILLLGDAVLVHIYGTPFMGNGWLYLGASLLFVLAYQFSGALFAVVAGDVVRALGFAGLYTAPAFGFAGVSFPRIAMNGFAYGWSAILPLTWYLQIRVDQMLRAAPLQSSLPALGYLCALTALFGFLLVLVLVLKKRAASRQANQVAVAA